MTLTTTEKLYTDATWDHSALTAFEQLRLQALVDLLPDDATSILDAGCGDGRCGRFLLTRRQVVLVSLDVVPKAVKLAPGARITGSLLQLPLKDRSLAAAVCSEVLEHLPEAKRRQALSELARVAERYLVLSFPYKEHLRARFITCPECGTRYNKDWHVHSFSESELPDLVPGFTLKTFRLVGKRSPLQRLRGRARTSLSGANPDSPCPLCGRSAKRTVTDQLWNLFLEALGLLATGTWYKPAWLVALYVREGEGG